MFWIGHYTAVMALVFWVALGVLVAGLFSYFDTFVSSGWSEWMVPVGFLVLIGLVPFRIAVWFINLVMQAFGRPLFYDLQIEDGRRGRT